MIEFGGAVAVVTGGAGGIGSALGRRLADLGARVALVDRADSPVGEVAATIPGAVPLQADVGEESDVVQAVQRVREELGPIDLYFSNAGLADAGGLGTDEDWEQSWRVHGLAHVYAARAVLPAMRERGTGAMVITASAAGLLMMMQAAPYTVTKHAAVALAEWLAVNYGGEGVQLHCLCPQGVRTPMVSLSTTGEAEVAASGRIIEPSELCDALIDAIERNEFLVLPHPEVHRYETRKVEDRDRWLVGMRRLLHRATGGAEE